MKIFFLASIAGRSSFLDNYKKIIGVLEKHGHKVYSDHVMKDSCDMEDLKHRKAYREYSKRILKLADESDAVVAEISYPSIMVGYLLNYSLRRRKHVLCLYQKNPHRILVGDSSKFLRLKKYTLEKENRLDEIINNFTQDIKNDSLHIRFNLMLDERTARLVDRQSRKMKISKANLIRNLLEENLEKKLN